MTDLPSLITRARKDKPYDRLVQELADELEKYVWRGMDSAPKGETVLCRLGNGELFSALHIEGCGWQVATDFKLPINPVAWMPIPSAS